VWGWDDGKKLGEAGMGLTFSIVSLFNAGFFQQNGVVTVPEYSISHALVTSF